MCAGGGGGALCVGGRAFNPLALVCSPASLVITRMILNFEASDVAPRTYEHDAPVSPSLTRHTDTEDASEAEEEARLEADTRVGRAK